MSNGVIIILKDIKDVLQAVRKHGQDDFFNAARRGDVGTLNVYMRRCAGRPYLQEDKFTVIHDLIDHPQSFKDPAATFNTITKEDFNFTEFFPLRISDSRVWSMYERQPTPDVAKISAAIAAEYLRYHLLRDGFGHRFSVDSLFVRWPGAEYRDDSLKMQMRKQRQRDCFLVVQNALVDYVAKEGPTLSLNRGGAFLSVVADDCPVSVSRLWTIPAHSFHEKSIHSSPNGDIMTIEPVFKAA